MCSLPVVSTGTVLPLRGKQFGRAPDLTRTYVKALLNPLVSSTRGKQFGRGGLGKASNDPTTHALSRRDLQAAARLFLMTAHAIDNEVWRQLTSWGEMLIMTRMI